MEAKLKLGRNLAFAVTRKQESGETTYGAELRFELSDWLSLVGRLRDDRRSSRTGRQRYEAELECTIPLD